MDQRSECSAAALTVVCVGVRQLKKGMDEQFKKK
jgi:hypothetical protein